VGVGWYSADPRGDSDAHQLDEVVPVEKQEEFGTGAAFFRPKKAALSIVHRRIAEAKSSAANSALPQDNIPTGA
jgi:hypothetical protein